MWTKTAPLDINNPTNNKTKNLDLGICKGSGEGLDLRAVLLEKYATLNSLKEKFYITIMKNRCAVIYS